MVDSGERVAGNIELEMVRAVVAGDGYDLLFFLVLERHQQAITT